MVSGRWIELDREAGADCDEGVASIMDLLMFVLDSRFGCWKYGGADESG